MDDFSKFVSNWLTPELMIYVPYLVYSQLEDWDIDEENSNENKEVREDVRKFDGDLIACWGFDTDCLGNIDNIGQNNGNYLEVTTVRVYSNKGKYAVLVTSRIDSDFHNGSTVEIWEKDVSKDRVYNILEELKEAQRKLYS